jgi:phosphonate transport system ATP-binding protein
MVQSPSVVLADEPVASLDPARAEEMLRLLTDLTTSAGKTLIVSLHSPYLIQKYCSRVIGLRNGQMAFDVPSSEVTEPLLDQLYDLNHQSQESAPEVCSQVS